MVLARVYGIIEGEFEMELHQVLGQVQKKWASGVLKCRLVASGCTSAQLNQHVAKWVREHTADTPAPPDSSVLGSEGGGPSIAHLRLSYFDRMNDSILLLCVSFMTPPSSRKKDHLLIRWYVSSFEMTFPVKVC